MKYLKCSLLFLITAFLFSCKEKDDEINKPFDRFLFSGMTDYVFQAGSYWVYKEEQSHEIDSIVLDSAVHNFTVATACGGVPGGHCVSTNYEFYLLRFKDVSKNQQFYQWVYATGIKYGVSGIFGQYSYDPFPGQTIFLWPYKYSGGVADYADTINDYSVAGQTLPFIVKEKVWVNSSSNFFQEGTAFYHAPNVGIVRKEIADSINSTHVWNLIKWNVVQ